MRRVKGKDSNTELAVRSLVHQLGYRFRLHVPTLPGKPDLVFPSRRKIIFVHGCFWHSHDCRAGKNKPQSNPNYWKPKLQRNEERDHEVIDRLCALGWSVAVVWECELQRPDELAERLNRFLAAP